MHNCALLQIKETFAGTSGNWCLPTPSSSQLQLQAVQSEVLWPNPQPSHKEDGELDQNHQSKHLVQVVAQPLPPVQLCKTFAPLFSFSYTTSTLRCRLTICMELVELTNSFR